VRGKKGLLIAMLLLLFATTIATLMPKAYAYETRLKFRYSEGYDYYHSGDLVRGILKVTVDIEAPYEWDNTPQGIVGWTFDVHVDPTVLEPYSVLGAFEGYYLYDFCSFWGYVENYPSLLVGSIDKTTGDIIDISEFIMGYKELGVGAGGPSGDPEWGYGMTGGLVQIKYKALQPDAYSAIEITDAWYWTPDGVKHPFDVVDVGHYNPPPVSEFPAGLGLLMVMAPAIPIVYIWRTRRKVTTK
jgi:hypothetical protein